MKKLFLIFILCIIIAGLVFFLHDDPGYAILSYRNWVISTSFWVALTSITLLFFVFYFLIRCISNVLSIPKIVKRKHKLHRALQYQKNMSTGISELITGDFKNAEKCFLKIAEDSESYIDYVLAAQAAQAQQAFDRRDHYLQKAFLFGKDATFAISLTQAQFFLKSDQWDLALPILKSLYQQAPKNPLILSGLKTIYFKLREWESLKTLLPQLKKQNLISQHEIDEMH